jgi:aspartate aminotransferase
VLFALHLCATQTVFGTSAAGAKENVIIIGSVSKTFAMTGWRIGYTLGQQN